MFDKVNVVVHIHVSVDQKPVDEEDLHPRDNKAEVEAWKRFFDERKALREKKS